MPELPRHPATQRVLEAAAKKGVTLEIRVFDTSTHTAEDAARQVGAELGQIVKSLVFVAPETDGLEPVICLVSGSNRVDIARLAAITGEPDIRRATAREASGLTGFTIGGIPPFGHPRPVRVVMDPDLGRFPVVWAAAGTSTAVFPVPPATLRMLANAHVAPLAEEVRRADADAAPSNGTHQDDARPDDARPDAVPAYVVPADAVPDDAPSGGAPDDAPSGGAPTTGGPSRDTASVAAAEVGSAVAEATALEAATVEPADEPAPA